MTVRSMDGSNPVEWTDGKRALWLLSPLLPALGVAFLALFYVSQSGLLLWGMPLFFYGLIPVLDLLIGVDRNNPPEAVVVDLEQD
ncbi:hypothetical protein RM532_14260, partial [Salinisphaera sp. W335]|nr:hypothetical protein [Salinisphaera sp. W335]